MSLRRGKVSGGFQGGITFDVKPPSIKGKHTYKTTQKTIQALNAGKKYGIEWANKLLFEDIGNWEEFDLDDSAPGDEFGDNFVDWEEPEEIGEFFLDNAVGAELGIEWEIEEDFELSPEEERAACAIAANDCGDQPPVGDEYDETEETISESRWLKLAGLLKD